MARSQYIYLVVESGYDWSTPRAAFTVKHELVSWLRAHKPSGANSEFEVFRLADGNRNQPPVGLDLAELLAE